MLGSHFFMLQPVKKLLILNKKGIEILPRGTLTSFAVRHNRPHGEFQNPLQNWGIFTRLSSISKNRTHLFPLFNSIAYLEDTVLIFLFQRKIFFMKSIYTFSFCFLLILCSNGLNAQKAKTNELFRDPQLTYQSYRPKPQSPIIKSVINKI